MLAALKRAKWRTKEGKRVDDYPADRIAHLLSVTATTEYHLPGVNVPTRRTGRVDVALTDQSSGQQVWLEVKVDATESGTQLETYADHGRLMTPRPVILALARPDAWLREPGLDPQGFDIGLLEWPEIRRVVSEMPGDPLWAEFVDFLEREQIIGPEVVEDHPLRPYLSVLEGVSDQLALAFPGSPLSWSEGQKWQLRNSAVKTGKDRLTTTGGPLTYGLDTRDGQLVWFMDVGTANYQRVPLTIEHLHRVADAAALPLDWRRGSAKRSVLSKTVPLAVRPSIDEAISWFREAIDELCRCHVLGEFLVGVRWTSRPPHEIALRALAEYRSARATLLGALNLPSSNRDPLAEFSEHFVAALCGGSLAESRVQRGHDLVTPAGSRVQVRYLANPPGRWVNEHFVDFSLETDAYALIVFESFEPQAVLWFERPGMATIGQRLGKRHPRQELGLQLTQRNFLALATRPEEFADAGFRLSQPPNWLPLDTSPSTT